MDTVNIKGLISGLTPLFERYRDRVKFAYLFGSLSKNNYSSLSDIDIAVFLSAGDRISFFDTRLSMYADICRSLARNDVDVIILNTIQNIILLDEIIRHGQVIYETDKDIREDFEIRVLHNAIDFKTQRAAIMGI